MNLADVLEFALGHEEFKSRRNGGMLLAGILSHTAVTYLDISRSKKKDEPPSPEVQTVNQCRNWTVLKYSLMSLLALEEI